MKAQMKAKIEISSTNQLFDFFLKFLLTLKIFHNLYKSLKMRLQFQLSRNLVSLIELQPIAELNDSNFKPFMWISQKPS